MHQSSTPVQINKIKEKWFYWLINKRLLGCHEDTVPEIWLTYLGKITFI